MKSWVTRFALLSLFLLTSACASVNVAKQKAFPRPKPGHGMVYVYREKVFQGWLTSQNIWENESSPRKIGAVKNGSYFAASLPPGRRTIFVNGEVRSAVQLDVKAGETYYLMCNINMGWWTARPKLTQVIESEALGRMKDASMVMTE